MSKKVEIRPVEGISVEEIEAALASRKLYFVVGYRWPSCAEGWDRLYYEVSVTRPKPLPCGGFYTSVESRIETPLTSTVLYNSGRDDRSTFLTDPRIQEIADKLFSLSAPESRRHGHRILYTWHRDSGVTHRRVQ